MCFDTIFDPKIKFNVNSLHCYIEKIERYIIDGDIKEILYSSFCIIILPHEIWMAYDTVDDILLSFIILLFDTYITGSFKLQWNVLKCQNNSKKKSQLVLWCGEETEGKKTYWHKFCSSWCNECLQYLLVQYVTIFSAYHRIMHCSHFISLLWQKLSVNRVVDNNKFSAGLKSIRLKHCGWELIELQYGILVYRLDERIDKITSMFVSFLLEIF